MLRSKTSKIYLAIGLAVFAIAGWYAYAIFAMPDIQSHVGDGQFTNHSWRFPWGSVGIPITGYTIEFAHFDLSNAYDAAYTMAQLPEIGTKAGVYLCIHDPSHKWRTDKSRAQLNAAVKIDVIDEKGQSVCHIKQPLAKMIWAEPEGGQDTYGLYLLDDSFFVPQPKEKYRIKASYSPDPKLDGCEGFIWVRCGGSI